MDRHLEELFERFRKHGDVAALGRVFDERAPVLARVARRLTRDRAGAEDLLQATFLAAIENAKRFDRSRALMPWLAGILVRQASLARRKKKPELAIDARELDAHEPRSRGSCRCSAGVLRRELERRIAIAFASVAPGEYTIAIEALSAGEVEGTSVYKLAMTPIPLTVAADQTVHVDLRP